MTWTVTAEGTRLRELFAGIRLRDEIDVPDIAVTDISASSDSVAAGGLFIACRGYKRHGLEFVDAALAANAAVVAWEPDAGLGEPELPENVVGLCVPELANRVGDIAARFFAVPASGFSVTGVTGTNGKTTTAWLTTRALTELGEPAGYMGTLGYGVGQELESSVLTTPGCIVVHRRLRKLADAGATAVVMEVSSHGLDQGRIDGVKLQTAAFTNLSRDHLDYHDSMDAYRDAKAKLFDVITLESAVINTGDPFGVVLADRQPANLELITVATDGVTADGRPATLAAEMLDASTDGLRIRFNGKYGSAEMRSPLWGAFNVENLLVAAGILIARGYTLDKAIKALASCEAPPGRMQIISGDAKTPLVVVDFCHTPDALAKSLHAVREHCDARICVVFGCGGNRDQGKRREMGAIATMNADRVIVTDDNPRDEDPALITDEIVAGVAGNVPVEVVHDRATAIETAIHAAGPDDAVLIAGKGSESFQFVAGNKQPFSDAAVAARILGVAA